MKAKKLMTTVLAASAVLAMSVNAMAAGSITNAVDTNNVSATQTSRKIVGEKKVLSTETVGVKLENVEADTFEKDLQREVDILNDCDAETTLQAAFEGVYGADKVPVINVYDKDVNIVEEAILKDYKFLSRVMNLTIDGEPTEEEPVEVTFTVNNLTDKIEPFILHHCEEHGWEILETEAVEGADNQITASFHSAGGPVAVVYRELPEEDGETDTDVVAP